MSDIVEKAAAVWDRKALEADLAQASAKLVEQAAEIERLRKALRDIDKHLTGDLSKPVIAVSLPLIRSIARTALGEKA